MAAAGTLVEGARFVISMFNSAETFTAVDRDLRLWAFIDGDPRQIWKCVRTQTHWGLINESTKLYLGWRGENLCCSAAQHNGWEYLTFVPGPGSCYQLMVAKDGRLCPCERRENNGGPYMTVVTANSTRLDRIVFARVGTNGQSKWAINFGV